MTTKFQPSAESLPPAVRTLKLIAATAERLSKEAADEELPTWVQVQIIQSANALGLVDSFVRNRKAAKERKK